MVYYVGVEGTDGTTNTGDETMTKPKTMGRKMSRAVKSYANRIDETLYGVDSVFTQEEQAAMKRGYTIGERMAMSGRMFGIYPQAISEEHARKLDIATGGR